MRRTRKTTLLAILIISLAVSYGVFVLLRGRGIVTPPVSYLTHLFFLLVNVWLFASGRAVKKMVAGEPSPMSPLGAARVLAAAKATAVVGSIVAGYFGGAVVAVSVLPHAPARVNALITSATGILVALVTVVVALIVEHWCAVDPPDRPTGTSAPEAA